MGTPTTTARQDPNGIRLTNGWRALFTFENDPDLSIWEIEVQPPGLDGGEPVDTSTQHNDVYETMEPRSLTKMTPMNFVAAYDPAAYPQLRNQLNVPQSITKTFPNGDTLDFFGYLQKFEPAALVNGTMPRANGTIIPTMTDPDDGTEAAFVYTEASGTTT